MERDTNGILQRTQKSSASALAASRIQLNSSAEAVVAARVLLASVCTPKLVFTRSDINLTCCWYQGR